LQPVERSLLRDRAYQILRDAIITGELEPGSVIKDTELADRVGLSRTPVREALTRLTEDGLVESKPHSWTRVTPLVQRDVHDALVVVRAMHDLAVRLAVPLMDKRHFQLMRAANRRFTAALDTGAIQQALDADDDLHGVPIEALGNRAIATTIERQMPLVRRLEKLRFGSLLGRRSVTWHEQLIDACEDGDVETAVAVNNRIWTTLIELFEAEGGTRNDDG